MGRCAPLAHLSGNFPLHERPLLAHLPQGVKMPCAVSGCFTFLPRWRSVLVKGEVDDPSYNCSVCPSAAGAVGRRLGASVARRPACGACPSGRHASACPRNCGCRQLGLLMPFQPQDATGAQPLGRAATGRLLLQWCEDRPRLQRDARGLSQVLQPEHVNSISRARAHWLSGRL